MKEFIHLDRISSKEIEDSVKCSFVVRRGVVCFSWIYIFILSLAFVLQAFCFLSISKPGLMWNEWMRLSGIFPFVARRR